MLKKKLIHWIVSRFAPVAAAVPEPQPQPFPQSFPQSLPQSLPQLAPQAAPEPKQPTRPMSAVEILQNEPNLTPAELADRAGVTLSYARSLVRRKQTRTAAPVIWPIAPRIPAAASQTPAVNRTQVIERMASGSTATAICEDLGMPKGEVDFILKVDRLKKNLKN